MNATGSVTFESRLLGKAGILSSLLRGHDYPLESFASPVFPDPFLLATKSFAS